MGMTVFLLSGLVFAESFVGSDSCLECHEAQFNQWKTSGHPYTLTRSEEARNRPMPLPQGLAWDDIYYVIGGNKWKSRYMDKRGYIITTTYDEAGNEVPGHNQYNYLTGQWTDYHAGEKNKPYTCGVCHTTGWVTDEDHASDNDLSDNQHGLPGIYGTFKAGGIQCEACHGFGREESIDKSAAFCGNCHSRGETDTIPAGGGFIRHHEQYNELLAGPHESLDCVDCHNPHQRAESSTVIQCSECHDDIAASYQAQAMADYDVECKDCHMPFASNSAQALGEFEGDLKTHIFYINTDPDANMFTQDGKFVALDENKKAAVTLDFVCKRCHEDMGMDELAETAKGFHQLTVDKTAVGADITGY